LASHLQYFETSVEASGVCNLLAELKGRKRDKREKEYRYPGIYRSDIAGCLSGRAGHGADCPGGGKWRSADQRPHRSTCVR
jgi:hypothetical protein